MAEFEWNEALSIDHDEIDAQHKKLIRIYNDAHEKLFRGDNRELASLAEETLTAISEYTRAHFAYEEGYMEKIGYPGLVKHWRAHKDFVSLVSEQIAHIRSGKTVLNSRVLKMLENWLVEHIMAEDRKIALFLSENSEREKVRP